MKYTLATLSLAVGLFANAQDLPQVSPKAKIEQRIGLTDVTVSYHRPSVKGRTIFGDVVPYNEVWRTGANSATLVTFSDNVEIDGNDLLAGTYALYMTPTEKDWSIHFNTVTESWGTGSYKEENNALSILITPTRVAAAKNQPRASTRGEQNDAKPAFQTPFMKKNFTETLRFSFEDITVTTANLVMAWETTTVSFSVKVDVDKKAMENITKAIAESPKDKLWMVYRNSANYMLQNDKDLKQGLTWIDESLNLNKTSWFSFWVKAQILAKLGNNKEAIANAQKAIELGEKEAKDSKRDFNYKNLIQTSIDGWK
jgi:tetratricopeptide (TPR) repeat protein